MEPVCLESANEITCWLCPAQPARDFIRSPFAIGTLDPISGLVELKQLDLFNCQDLTGTFGCGGTARTRFHWLISSNWAISLANLLYLPWVLGSDEFKAAHPNCSVIE